MLYDIIDEVSSKRIEKDITKLVSFGTRHSLSDTLSEINTYDGDDLKLVITFGCMNIIDNPSDYNWDDRDKQFINLLAF